MSKNIVKYNGHDYEIIIKDNTVTVCVTGKSVYTITKSFQLAISDTLVPNACAESQDLMIKTAEADIKSGIMEKHANKLGLI